MRELARISHRDTRFYFDPHFPAGCCDVLYATWIGSSCRGWADSVLVAESAGDRRRRPAGYITCHLEGAGGGRIGLLAVAPEYRGRGVGRGLVEAACQWFGAEGRRRVTVATQARNVQALKLYVSSGFIPHAVQLWYHRWFENEGGGPTKATPYE